MKLAVLALSACAFSPLDPVVPPPPDSGVDVEAQADADAPERVSPPSSAPPPLEGWGQGADFGPGTGCQWPPCPGPAKE